MATKRSLSVAASGFDGTNVDDYWLGSWHARWWVGFGFASWWGRGENKSKAFAIIKMTLFQCHKH